MLRIQTARFSYDGPFRLDVTRKGKSIFGPSAGLLKWVKTREREVAELRKMARTAPQLGLFGDGDPGVRNYSAEADALETASWMAYKSRYLDEMRMCRMANREAWAEIRRKERIVFVCYCAIAKRCHRVLLADEFVDMGNAVYEGEVIR